MLTIGSCPGFQDSNQVRFSLSLSVKLACLPILYCSDMKKCLQQFPSIRLFVCSEWASSLAIGVESDGEAMEPLTELPVNHIARNGNIGQRPDVLHGGNAGPGILNENANSAFEPSPSSIKDMLKNTTEIGDVGQFSIKPSRKPHSVVRTSPVGPYRGASSSNHSRDLHGQPHGHEDPQISPGLSRHDITASAMASRLPSHGTATYCGHGGPPIEEFRSYSMTQNSYVSHSLTNRHPVVNGSYQGRGIGPSGRPRSPFAYPTRLKRPGYRPSSPALSDMNRPRYYSRPNSRPISPTSLYSINRVPASWQQNVNHSDPSLRYHLPSNIKEDALFRNPSPASSQPSTPRPASSLRSVASSSRLPRPHLLMQNMWTHHESPSPSPLFYDYTEAFEELRHSQRLHMSARNLNGPKTSTPETDTHFNPEFAASGPDAMGIPTEDAEVQSTPTINEASRRSSVRISVPPTGGVTITQPKTKQTPRDLESSQYTSFEMNTSMNQASPTRATDDGRVPSPLAARLTLPTIQSAPEPAETDSQPPAGAESLVRQNSIANWEESDNHGRSSSSSTDSMRTAESNSCLDQEGLRNPTSRITAALPEKEPETHALGHVEVNQASNYAKTQCEGPGAPDFEGQSFSEHTEIISPTPERSIASYSNRDRFSKILGLDESLPDLEDAVHDAYQEKGSIQNSGNKRSRRVRQSHARSNTIDSSILEEDSLEDERELSTGLLKTVGQQIHQQKEPVPPSAAIEQRSRRTVVNHPVPTKTANPIITRQESISDSKPLSSCESIDEAETTKPPRHSAAARQNRHAQILSSKSKTILRVDKELPPVPNPPPSFVAITPPPEKEVAEHPFAFTPLDYRRSEHEPLDEIEAVTASSSKNTDADECLRPPPALNSTRSGDRDSVASSHGSRPWNNDSNYPWSDQPPDLEVTIPQPIEKLPLPAGRTFPRFKLRIHRASTSTVSSTRLTKCRPSSDGTSSSKRNSGHEILRTTTFKRKGKPKVSVSPGQDNSSHDVANESLRTRFVETFDPPPQIATVISSPTITLLPPSPGHEVRSFFSDDSSQARQKGSIRKRLSDFKARHSQTTSTEDVRGYDRGLLTSALGRSRASGRSSRQSQNTAGGVSYKSQIKRVRSKVINKVRFWWHRGEDRVRGWGWRMRSHQEKSHALHADLYPGA